LALLSQGLGGLLGLASALVLARWLGAEGFGAYGVTLSALALMSLPATLGLDKAALRFIPQYRDAPARRQGFTRFAVTVAFLGGLIAATAALSIGVWLSSEGGVYGRAMVASSGLAIFLPLHALASGLARANGRALLAVAPGEVLRRLIQLAMIGGFVLAGVSGSTTLALFSATLAAGAGLALQFIILRRDSTAPSARPEYLLRDWLGLSVPMLTISGLNLVIAHSSTLIVGAILGPADAGAYVAAVRFSALVTLVLGAINFLAAPVYADLHARGATEELASLVRRCAHLIFWPTLATALTVMAAGPWLLASLGPDFNHAYPALLILVAGQLVNAGAGSVGYLAQLTGDQRGALVTLGFSAVVGLILSLALIPIVGLIGAAFASATSTAAWNIVLHRRIVRRLGVRPAITDALRGA
jgi:O-antigen/teichoic acid export membrane protein